MSHIQAVAIELFETRGYRVTTIEEVAAAAMVAPSTVYRYFGTKERLVLRENADEQIMDLLADLLRTMPPVAAVRAALGATDADALMSGDAVRRLRLILAVPELIDALVVATYAAGRELGRAIASARGLPDDRAAVQGTAIAAALHVAVVDWHAAGAGPDLAERLTAALAALEEIT